MSTLREVLEETRTNRVAIGPFNFSELVVLKAATEAASELGVPVVMGLSESEREFLGVKLAAALVHSMREEQEGEIFLNADHTHSIESAEEAARARFDMIVFDASEKPLPQNIAETRRGVEAVKSIHPEMLVEGEMGYVTSGSEIHEKRPDSIRLTEPEQARELLTIPSGLPARSSAVSGAKQDRHESLQPVGRWALPGAEVCQNRAYHQVSM